MRLVLGLGVGDRGGQHRRLDLRALPRRVAALRPPFGPPGAPSLASPPSSAASCRASASAASWAWRISAVHVACQSIAVAVVLEQSHARALECTVPVLQVPEKPPKRRGAGGLVIVVEVVGVRDQVVRGALELLEGGRDGERARGGSPGVAAHGGRGRVGTVHVAIALVMGANQKELLPENQIAHNLLDLAGVVTVSELASIDS